MLKTCSVVLAIAMSIGAAQARHVIPGCAVGQPTAWKCNCGSAAAPVLCRRGQWCKPNHMMAEGPFCSS
jgi:hypothetical protein